MNNKPSYLFCSILLACASSPVLAFSQSELDHTAKNLNVFTYLVENKSSDCPEGAVDNYCYRVEIKLTNQGKHPLNKDAEIYFSNIHRILKSNTEGFDIQHINGDLHRIVMTDKFKGLAPGESATIQFDAMNWVVSDTDFMPNYYLAYEGLEARNIANTVPVRIPGSEDLTGFSRGILSTENQLKRNSGDLVVSETGATRFESNKQVKDLGVEVVKTGIIPSPNKMIQTKAIANIAEGINLIAQKDALPADQVAALNARLNTFEIKTGQGFPVEISVAPQENGISGAYRLEVTPEKAVIIGQDTAGAFYGVQSLIGLINLGETNIATVKIEDAPRYPYRGMHLDVSRNFHSKEFVLKLLDQMAAYKLNKFHFHLADDEGWRLEIKGLPELTDIGSKRCHDPEEKTCLLPQLGSGADTTTNGSGHYSMEDYKEILAYAKARNIQVIPSMDMPGHSRAAIKSMEARYDKFMAAGDREAAEMYLLSDPYDKTQYYSVQNYTDNTINPCMESTYIFFDKVISEIKNLHDEAGVPLTDYHIGADETAGAWKDSPKCRQLYVNPQSGVRTSKDILPYFVNRISYILDNHNLTLGAWNDGLTHTKSADLTDGATAYVWSTLFWGGSPNYNKFLNNGFEVVLATPDTLYFDHPYEADPRERGYYWATRYSDTQEVFNFMPENISANAEHMTDRMGAPLDVVSNEKNGTFRGMQGNLWSETIRHSDQVEYMIFPRLIALAERAWHKADWEAEHKTNVNYKTNVDGHKGTNHMGEDLAKRDQAWQTFANIVGYKEMPKMDASKITYRIPVPGAIIQDGQLDANITFPGLKLEYSTDGKKWQAYDAAAKPKIQDKAWVRAVAKDGRVGRAVEAVKS